MAGSVSPSRPDAHEGAGRRDEASLGEPGTGDRIGAALHRGADRVALAGHLAASGVLRELLPRVDGPVAHPVDPGQRAWGGPERLWQAQDAGAAPAPGAPGAGWGRVADGVLGRHPLGRALLALEALGGIGAAEPRRAVDIAAGLGLDGATAEGRAATLAFQHVGHLSGLGELGPVATNGAERRVAGEAAALYEMSYPGTYGAAHGGDAAALAALLDAADAAVAAPAPDPEGPQLTGHGGGPEGPGLDGPEVFVPVDPSVLGNGVVTMADPNNGRAVRTQQQAADRLRAAFPDATILEEVPFPAGPGHAAGDIDILIDGVPVEVTSGRGRDKQEQLPKIELATGQSPILYGTSRLGGTVERNLREQGYTVVRSLDELEAAVRARRDADAG